MGAAALLAPLAAYGQASCPSLQAGDLFKVPGNSAVYLLNANMQRLYFPHSSVYHSWYTDFSGVVEIPTTCVDAYPSPSVAPYGINWRPGSRMVKVQISPSVYAMLPNNTIAKIGSESVASALYGSNWASEVVDVADPFWPNYAGRAADLTEAKPHDGMFITTSGSGSVWYVQNGTKVVVDGYARGDVQTVSQAVADAVPTGIGTVAAASVYQNPSQGVGGGSSVPTPTPVPTPANGNLTVSLASDTPSGTFGIKGAARVAFTKVMFTAGSAEVRIDSMRISRSGSPAQNSDFSTVNIIDQDGNLLNDSGKSLNSDNQATFTEDIIVPANSSKTYTLVGDLATTVGNGDQPILQLDVVNLSGSGTVTGLPVIGNSVEMNNNITLGTATLAEGSVLSTVTKRVGDVNVDLASLKITVATNDARVERIVFYNSSSTADGDVENFKLRYQNNVIASGQMVNKYVTFNLASCGTECDMLKGNDKTFTVTGDVVGGSGRTMNLDIQKTVHVLVRDTKNGVYVTPSFGTTSAASMDNSVVISQGTLNVSKVNNVPAGDVPSNASGIALASFNFKVTGEPIDVRTLVFRVSTTGTVVPTGIDSIIIYNASGVGLTGGVDATGAASPGYATSTDSFTLPVGDNILTVKGKIDNTPANNDTVMISIDMRNTTNFDAKGSNTNETITLGTYATPQALVDGNTQTIKTAALRVTQLPTPPTTTYAAGISNVVLAEVSFDAGGSSEDLRVTQVKTKDFADGGGKTIDIQNIRLFVDKDGDSYNGSGSQVALAETKNGSDSTANNDEGFTFNLSGADQFTIKAGKKLVVTIKGDIAGGAAVGNHIFRSNLANDVTAVGVSTGNTVSETVDTAPQGQTVKVAAAGGTVEVNIDTGNADSRLFAAGTTGVTLATFNFYATTTEDVEIDSIYFTQRVTDTASAAFQDYDLLYVVDEAGNTVGSVVPTSTKPFIDLNAGAFVVGTADTDGAKLYLKANLSNIGPSLNVTVGGHRLGFNIAAAGDVTAKGVQTGSGSVEYLGTNTPNGNTHYMFKGYPSVEKLTLSSDKLAATADMYKFKVTANGGDIGLYKFVFDITTTAVTLTNLELYDVTDTSSETLLFSSSSPIGPNPLRAEILLDDDNPTSGDGGEERTVSRSQARTFVLRGSFTGIGSGDSVSTRMAGDTAIYGGRNAATLMASSTGIDGDANNADDFIWSDRHASSHSTTTADWHNGYLVTGNGSASSSAAVLSF